MTSFLSPARRKVVDALAAEHAAGRGSVTTRMLATLTGSEFNTIRGLLNKMEAAGQVGSVKAGLDRFWWLPQITRQYIEDAPVRGITSRDIVLITRDSADDVTERRCVLSFPPGTPAESVPEALEALRAAYALGASDREQRLL